MPGSSAQAPVQPGHGFRMCADSLLLASFADRVLPGSVRSIADLGCGTGGVMLTLCSMRRDISCLGVEGDAAAYAALCENMAALGRGDRVSALLCDLSALDRALDSSFDGVLANPPFYDEGEGRPSRDRGRNAAMHATAALPLFLAAARRLLRPRGFFCCIYPAYKLQRLMTALAEQHMGVRSVLPVASRRTAPPFRILVAARRDSVDYCDVAHPLVLHAGRKRKTLTREALDFCPMLAAAQCAPS